MISFQSGCSVLISECGASSVFVASFPPSSPSASLRMRRRRLSEKVTAGSLRFRRLPYNSLASSDHFAFPRRASKMRVGRRRRAVRSFPTSLNAEPGGRSKLAPSPAHHHSALRWPRPRPPPILQGPLILRSPRCALPDLDSYVGFTPAHSPAAPPLSPLNAPTHDGAGAVIPRARDPPAPPLAISGPAETRARPAHWVGRSAPLPSEPRWSPARQPPRQSSPSFYTCAPVPPLCRDHVGQASQAERGADQVVPSDHRRAGELDFFRDPSHGVRARSLSTTADGSAVRLAPPQWPDSNASSCAVCVVCSMTTYQEGRWR